MSKIKLMVLKSKWFFAGAKVFFATKERRHKGTRKGEKEVLEIALIVGLLEERLFCR
jgi:hypothetical protein